MSAERFRNQTVTLTDGTKVKNKTVRLCSAFLFDKLTDYTTYSWDGLTLRTHIVPQRGTFGTAKVRGYEIPVLRRRRRNGSWRQEGIGRLNDASSHRYMY